MATNQSLQARLRDAAARLDAEETAPVATRARPVKAPVASEPAAAPRSRPAKAVAGPALKRTRPAQAAAGELEPAAAPPRRRPAQAATSAMSAPAPKRTRPVKAAAPAVPVVAAVPAPAPRRPVKAAAPAVAAAPSRPRSSAAPEPGYGVELTPSDFAPVPETEPAPRQSYWQHQRSLGGPEGADPVLDQEPPAPAMSRDYPSPGPSSSPGWAATATPSPPPGAYPPPGYPSLPAGSGPRRSRGPLIATVAIVLVSVLALLVILVATTSSDDGDGATAVADRPMVSQDDLYATIPGYGVDDLPEGLLDVVRSPFDNLPDLEGTLRDLSGRNLTRSGSPVAQVFVYQFKEDFGSTPGAADGFKAGFASISADTEDVTVAGIEALSYRLANGVSGIAGIKGAAAVVVQGPPAMTRQQLTDLFTTMVGRLP